jgi:hypothetical protein
VSKIDKAAVFEALENRPAGRMAALVLAACVLAGIIAFAIALMAGMTQRAWQAFLVNLVYWTGLSCGAVMFSAVLIITKANWGRSLKRLAEAPVLFLPLAFVLFGLLYFGRHELFPWIDEPPPEKAVWLNFSFMYIRQGGAFFVLAAAALGMVYHGVHSDRRMLAHPGHREMESDGRHQKAQTVYANIFGICFGVLLSLIAFDLIMSLEPHWHSTLFGAYYFVGSFFSGIATLIILAFIAKRWLGLQAFIRPLHLHNLGKLLLGFCLLTADFFYTQFFIIWYGNLPEETHFVLERVRMPPWKTLSYVVLAACFILPFIVLLSRRIKLKHGIMVGLCTLILVGMWLERFILIAPSIWKDHHLPLGPIEVLISMGFFGLTGLCILLFVKSYPLLPVSDPLFWEGLNRKH